MIDYEYIDLKPYKGFTVQKVYKLTFDGKRKEKPFYVVSDNNDMIGEQYKSVTDAHKYIDSITN